MSARHGPPESNRELGTLELIFAPFYTMGRVEMAKAVPGRARKAAARKAPVPAKRKAAATPLTSAAKFKALVDNLTTTELDELIKAATARKNEEIAGARASFLDEVKARAASLGMSLADLVGLDNGKAAKGARCLPDSRWPVARERCLLET